MSHVDELLREAERTLAYAETISSLVPVDRDSFNRGWDAAVERVRVALRAEAVSSAEGAD